MITEFMTTVGYMCTDCHKVWEFPSDAYQHYCPVERDHRIAENVRIMMDVAKPNGEHEGIALCEPRQIVISTEDELRKLRSEVRQIIGRY